MTEKKLPFTLEIYNTLRKLIPMLANWNFVLTSIGASPAVPSIQDNRVICKIPTTKKNFDAVNNSIPPDLIKAMEAEGVEVKVCIDESSIFVVWQVFSSSYGPIVKVTNKLGSPVSEIYLLAMFHGLDRPPGSLGDDASIVIFPGRIPRKATLPRGYDRVSPLAHATLLRVEDLKLHPHHFSSTVELSELKESIVWCKFHLKDEEGEEKIQDLLYCGIKPEVFLPPKYPLSNVLMFYNKNIMDLSVTIVKPGHSGAPVSLDNKYLGSVVGGDENWVYVVSWGATKSLWPNHEMEISSFSSSSSTSMATSSSDTSMTTSSSTSTSSTS